MHERASKMGMGTSSHPCVEGGMSWRDNGGEGVEEITRGIGVGAREEPHPRVVLRVMVGLIHHDVCVILGTSG